MRAQRIYLEACMERDEYNYIEESVCVRIQWAQQTGNRNSVAMAIVMAVVHTKREHTTEVREQRRERESTTLKRNEENKSELIRAPTRYRKNFLLGSTHCTVWRYSHTEWNVSTELMCVTFVRSSLYAIR